MKYDAYGRPTPRRPRVPSEGRRRHRNRARVRRAPVRGVLARATHRVA
jgi:hypothetical protein